MKTLYTNILIVLFLFTTQQIFAQQDKYNWRIGAHSGIMSYYGDLSSQYFETNRQTLKLTKNLDFLTHGISIEKSFSPVWSFRLSGSYGQFIAEDRSINFKNELLTDDENSRRALNVKTNIIDGGLMLTRYFGKKTFISPYITLGAGYTFFETNADLFDANGKQYHYWSDQTVRDIAEDAPDAFNANEIERDYDYETALNGLLTEGVDYETQTFSFPVGIGLKFRLSSRLNLNLETVSRYTLTDYLDDVSGTYLETYDNALQQHAAVPGERLAGNYRGREDDKLNDIYSYSSISLHYNFGRKKESFRAPFVYVNPLDSVAVAAEVVKDSTGWTNPLLSVPVYAEKEAVSQAPLAETATTTSPPETVNQTPTLAVTVEEREKSDDEIYQEVAALKDEIKTLKGSLTSPEASQTSLPEIVSLSEEVKKMESEIEAYEAEIKKLKGELSSLPPQDRDYRDVKIEELEAEIEKLRDTKSTENNKEITDLKTEIKKLNESQVKTPQERDERDIAVQKMQRELDQIRQEQDLLIQATLTENNKAIKANSQGIRDMRKDMQELKTLMIAGNVAQTSQLQGKTNSSNEEVESLRRQLALMEAKLNAGNNSAPDNTDVLIEMNKQLTALQQEVNALRNRPVQTVVAPAPVASTPVMTTPAPVITRTPAPTIIYSNTSTAKDAIIGFEKTNVYFEVNSQAVKTEFNERLNRIADLASRYAEVVITINGYADKGGNSDHNLMLSRKRAEAVKAYLLQRGTNPAQLSTQFFGSGISTEVSSFDRRVEIQLLVQ